MKWREFKLATLDLSSRESLSQIGHRERRVKNRRKTNATRSKSLDEKIRLRSWLYKKLERRGLAFRKQGRRKCTTSGRLYEILEKRKGI